MILIQTMKWFGPTREAPKPDLLPSTNEPTSYATALPLADALAALRAYDNEFRAHYRITAVEHTLLGVQQIDDLGEDDLDNARIWTVEALLANHRQMVAEEAA